MLHRLQELELALLYQTILLMVFLLFWRQVVFCDEVLDRCDRGADDLLVISRYDGLLSERGPQRNLHSGLEPLAAVFFFEVAEHALVVY